MAIRDRPSALFVDLSLLLGAFLLLYRRLLDSGVSLATTGLTDLKVLSQPAYVFSGRSLLEGRIPWWNPHWFAGFPHFEMPESAIFYPTTLLYGPEGFALLSKLDMLGGRECPGSRECQARMRSQRVPGTDEV